jgi:uncharacterized protein (TIGR03663 family)
MVSPPEKGPKSDRGMNESALDRPLIGKLTLEKSLYLFIFVAALALRFYNLGERPYHHDESIHAFFSWKITENGFSEYRYDPVYHGPLLYYTTAAMLWFGDNDFTGRLSAVLFGIGILAFAWPLRRYLGRWGALSFLALVAFSPAWTYFTRFVRHDIYLATCNLGAVYWAFRYGDTAKSKYLYFSAAALSLAFCNKEDMYLMSPLFLIGLGFMVVWPVLYGEKKLGTALAETGSFLTRSLVPILTSLIIFAIIWAVMYTSFGQHPENWNAVGRAIEYWWGQHNIKRIGGHWTYYIPQLLLYDPLIFLPTVALIVGALFTGQPRTALGRVARYGAVACIAGVAITAFARPDWTAILTLAAAGLGVLTLATTWLPDPFTRFSIVWAVGAVAIYAWAQEKVPWLLIPQLLPLTLVAGRWFGRLIESRALLAPSLLLPVGTVSALTLWTLIASNFLWDAPKPDEPGASLAEPIRHEELLSYVQSTYDINKAMRRIEEVGEKLGTGTETRLAVSGDATWPFSWYLRHYPVNWSSNLRNIDQPVVIVDKSVAKSTDEVLLEAYEHVPIQIRGWWEPRWGELTLSKIVRFLLTRQVWSGVGSSDAVMYVYKDLTPGATIGKFTVNPPPAARGYPRAPSALAPLAVWGGEGSGRGQFEEPRGLAADSSGNLFVADTKNNRVQKLSPSGEVLAVWGTQGDQPGQFKDPHGIAVGPDDSVYVADTWNHRIQQFDNNGTYIRHWTEPGFWGPRAVGVGTDGNVYVADTGNKRIVSFTSTGGHLETWGADGSAPKQFIEPVGVTVNELGEVIVCDTGNRRLQVFLGDGTFQKEFPIFGWEEFYSEPYITTLGEDVFVTDSYNHRFARYRDGKIKGSWGKTGKGPGDFNRPIGIAAFPPNILYVSDTLNHRIQKFEIPAE